MTGDDRRLRALDEDERREQSPAREAHDALETALFEIKRVIVGQEAMLERVQAPVVSAHAVVSWVEPVIPVVLRSGGCRA